VINEYKRHGTLSLLAGIDLLTSQVHALVRDRHRGREFIEFLKMLDAAYPANTVIKLILDNHSAHISRESRTWLATRPDGRFEFTFTPAAKNGNQIAVLPPCNWDDARRSDAPAAGGAEPLGNANKFPKKALSPSLPSGTGDGRDWVTLSVADTGIGMTAEQMGKLFQEFSQASSTTASKYGGTGVGLVISRRFCQMMGGDITATSEPGNGCDFLGQYPDIFRRAPTVSVTIEPQPVRHDVQGLNVALLANVRIDETGRRHVDRR